MKNLLVVMLFLSILHTNAQTAGLTEKMIEGKWIIKKGWFDKGLIELEKFDTANHKSFGTLFVFDVVAKKGVYNVFDKKFYTELHNPEGLGMCGNGLLYIDKGEWILKNNELTIDVKGGHALENEFHYIIVYDIKVKDNRLLLTQKKSIKCALKSYTG